MTDTFTHLFGGEDIARAQRNAGELAVMERLAAMGIENDEQKLHRLRMAEPKGMRRLRWLLAIAYAGPRLYRDDGEYSDPESGIDFRRDSVDEIERKMQANGGTQSCI